VNENCKHVWDTPTPDANDQTLGNSDELRKAQNALKDVGHHSHIEGRTEGKGYSGFCKTLLIKTLLIFLEV
jgi:hypothetical protein